MFFVYFFKMTMLLLNTKKNVFTVLESGGCFKMAILYKICFLGHFGFNVKTLPKRIHSYCYILSSRALLNNLGGKRYLTV